MLRELLAKGHQRLHGRGGAFHVRIVDHDVAEDNRRIQQLVPSPTPVVLVGRPGAVAVLVRQKELHAIEAVLVRELRLLLDTRVLPQGQHRLEGLRACVRNGPSLLGGAEAPAAADRLPPMPPVPVRQHPDLLAGQPCPCLGTHLGELLLQTGLGGGLDREGRVPSHAAVVALALQAVLGDPHVRRHAGDVRLERLVFGRGNGVLVTVSGNPRA
mmetsp:Transcript_22789/g.65690  ORF Transcript_22789/g.65690 Transcript_22789/m.65690 type:complete len:214 (+) Transcript_22789:645-1286(+)